MRTKRETEDELVRILRAHKALPADDRERRAMMSRDLAATVVELREHHLTPEGRPDWTGKTWAYREDVRRAYSEADYTPEERTTSQASIRYHIGNILRQQVSTEELEAAGISAPSPHERQAAKRERNAALLAASTGETPTLDTLRDILAALKAARPADYAGQTATAKRLLESIINRSQTILRTLPRE